MNTDLPAHVLLQSFLDGTLDPAGEQAALQLLESSAEARREFAQLAQLQLWLATDPATQHCLTTTARRRIIRHPAWWLAAAVAAAVIIFTATRLWPAPGDHQLMTSGVRIRPMLAAACAHCHEQIDRFFSTASGGLAMVDPGRPESSALWLRISADNPCGRSLSPGDRSVLYSWIREGAPS